LTNTLKSNLGGGMSISDTPSTGVKITGSDGLITIVVDGTSLPTSDPHVLNAPWMGNISGNHTMLFSQG
jgi:hypothetical protein